MRQPLVLGIALLVAAAVVSHAALDARIARAAAEAELVRSRPIQWITEAGEGLWWILGSTAVFAVAAIGRRHNLARWAFAVLAAVVGSGLIVNLLKVSIGRMRPERLLEHGEFGFLPFTVDHDYNSFPSGHATTCAAATMVLALALPRWRWLFLCAGIAIASTRVAIHAHYLSDVLAGLALGYGCGHATLVVWRRRWPASEPVPYRRKA